MKKTALTLVLGVALMGALGFAAFNGILLEDTFSGISRMGSLAQVILSVNVVNPDFPADGGGGNNSNSGGTGGAGAGGGGGGGALALVTPPKTDTVIARSKGDINGDGKVSLADFSILAYWYKRPLTADAKSMGVDLNNDGKVTLADFSILAYYWNRT